MSLTGPLLQGIGEAGEDIGKGAEANVLQQHQFTMDYLANQARNRQLGLEQQNLDQQNQIAHSQLQLEGNRQDLERQQFERQGLQYAGAVSDADGNYYRSYMDPLRGTSIRMPYPPGVVPIDSPAGQANARKVMIAAGFPEQAVDQALLHISSTGDPTERLSTWLAYAKASGAIPSEIAGNKAKEFAWGIQGIKEIQGGFNPFDPLAAGGGMTPSEAAEYNQLVTQPLKEAQDTYKNQMAGYTDRINKIPVANPYLEKLYPTVPAPMYPGQAPIPGSNPPAYRNSPSEGERAKAETLRQSAEDAHKQAMDQYTRLGQQLTMTYNARHGQGPFRSSGPAVQKFTVGDEVYNIPTDLVDAFKAAHPNAQQQ